MFIDCFLLVVETLVGIHQNLINLSQHQSILGNFNKFWSSLVNLEQSRRTKTYELLDHKKVDKTTPKLHPIS